MNVQPTWTEKTGPYGTVYMIEPVCMGR